MNSRKHLPLICALVALLVPGAIAQGPVYAARIDGTTAPNNHAVIHETPGFNVELSASNSADSEIRRHAFQDPLPQADGVLIANPWGAGVPYVCAETPGELTHTAGFPKMWVSTADGAGELAADVSLGSFRFADGFAGGHVDAAGTLVGSGNLPAGTTIVKTGTGTYELTMPGIDTEADGILLITAASNVFGSNEGRTTAATPRTGGGLWDVTAYGMSTGVLTDAPFSFVYLPYSSPGLIAGRVQADGTLLNATGGPSIVKIGPGVYDVFAPGLTAASDGVLLVSNAALTGSGEDNVLSTEEFAPGSIRVTSRDMPGGSAQNGGFVFCFIRFQEPFGTTQDMGAAAFAAGPSAATYRTAGFPIAPGPYNLGDVTLLLDGTTFQQSDGVMMATVNDDAPGTVLEVGGQLSQGSANIDLAISNAGSETDVATAAAWFPYAAGWLGGHVDGAGNVLGSSNLPLGAGVSQTGVGRYTVTLGPANPLCGGLFVIGNSNNDHNYVACNPTLTGWDIAVRHHDETPENDGFSFLYMPWNTPNLIGGLVNISGTIVAGPGGATITHSATGTYEISIPGVTSESAGMLLLSVADTGAGIPDDNYLQYTWDAVSGRFIVKNYDITAHILQNSDFVFAFVPYEAPLQAPVAPGLSLEVGGYDVSGSWVVYTHVRGGTPFSKYFTCLTFVPGNYPNGYWFGIDPSITDIVSQFSSPLPLFNGFLDACGEARFDLPLGTPGPLGLTTWGVTVELNALNFIQQASPAIDAGI